MFCTIGASKRVMQLAEDAPYVCPVCGKPLSAPVAPNHARLVGVTMFGIGICLAGTGAFLAGAVLGINGTWQAAPEIETVGVEKIKPPPVLKQYAMLHSPATIVVPPGGPKRRLWRHKSLQEQNSAP